MDVQDFVGQAPQSCANEWQRRAPGRYGHAHVLMSSNPCTFGMMIIRNDDVGLWPSRACRAASAAVATTT